MKKASSISKSKLLENFQPVRSVRLYETIIEQISILIQKDLDLFSSKVNQK